MNIMNSYPTSYIGFVNSFGETEIKVNKQNYRFIASKIPKTYAGSINYQGEIIMQTDKTELEWTTDCYVNKVIADPFSGNNAKRNQFLLNMREMKAMIQEARKNQRFD